MIRTKGTELYMMHNGKLEKIACVSAISVLSETMRLRGRSTLCIETPKSEPSFPEFSDVNFTVRLSSDISRMIDMQRNRDEVELIVGFGDSKDQPTKLGQSVAISQNRTWVQLRGYFSGFTIPIEMPIIQTSFTFHVLEQFNLTTKRLIPWSNDLPWSNGQYWR